METFHGLGRTLFDRELSIDFVNMIRSERPLMDRSMVPRTIVVLINDCREADFGDDGRYEQKDERS